MLFFDLDGTLLDSNGVWLDIDIAFLGRHGVTPVPEDYTWYVTHHSAPARAAHSKAVVIVSTVSPLHTASRRRCTGEQCRMLQYDYL